MKPIPMTPAALFIWFALTLVVVLPAHSDTDAFVHVRMANADRGSVLKDGVSIYRRKDWMAKWAMPMSIAKTRPHRLDFFARPKL